MEVTGDWNAASRPPPPITTKVGVTEVVVVSSSSPDSPIPRFESSAETAYRMLSASWISTETLLISCFTRW